MDFTVFSDLKTVFSDFHGPRFGFDDSVGIQIAQAFSNTRFLGFESDSKSFFLQIQGFQRVYLYIYKMCGYLSLSLQQQQQKILSKHLLLSRENVILCLPEAIVDRFISLPNLIYSNVIII